MSYLKYSDNLFLGKPELNRDKKFKDDDGFRNFLMQNSVSFGLIENEINNLVNAKIEPGTTTGTIKHSLIRGIDSDGLFFTKDAQDNIALTDDDSWYWIKVSHTYTSVEKGTVDVSMTGDVSSPNMDTEFLTVLRSQPNFPSKIKFPNSASNTLEYEVASLIDDHNLVLAGAGFIAEEDLNYQIVGTFSPDAVPSSGDKFPFQYDSCTFTIVAELVENTKPAHTAGKEFFIYRVKRNGSAVTIQDKRTEYWQTRSNYFLRSIDRLTRNPLAGVESIRYDSPRGTKTKNIVKIAWGFRSSNWTSDVNLNRITLVGGQGGIFKTTADFTNSDFDGWRVYTQSGRFYRVKQSSIASDQINLDLDVLEIDDFGANSSQELVVVPNIEDITIIFDQNSFGSDLVHREYTFPVQKGYADIGVDIHTAPLSTYIVRYKYKSFKDASPVWLIHKGTGYYTESSFNDDGSLKDPEDRTLKITTGGDNGVIELVEHFNSHTVRLDALDTGDRPGNEFIALDNGTLLYELEVLVNKTFQYVYAPTTDEITFTDNHIINLKSNNAKSGNRFFIYITADITFDSNDLEIRQDYVDVGTPGDLLYTIDESEYESVDFDDKMENNILLMCEFNTSFPEDIPTSTTPDGRWTVIPLLANAGEILPQIKKFKQVVNDATLEANLTGSIVTQGNFNTLFPNVIQISGFIVNDTGGNISKGDKIATLHASAIPLIAAAPVVIHAVAVLAGDLAGDIYSPIVLEIASNGDLTFEGIYSVADSDYRGFIDDDSEVYINATYMRSRVFGS